MAGIPGTVDPWSLKNQSQNTNTTTTRNDAPVDLHWLVTGERSDSVIGGALDYNGITVFEAAREGNLPVTQLLLVCGEDINRKESGGRKGTLLHWAAYHGHESLVNYLLDHGADINEVNGQPDSACMTASFKKEKEDSGYGQTPLMWAAQTGSMEMCQKLIQRGAKPDATDYDGRSTLFHAASNPLLLCYLVSVGVPVDLPDRQGRSVLHYCAHNSYFYSALYLLEKANWRDVSCKDSSSATPLHWAAMAGDTEMVKLLVAHGASISTTNNAGHRPCDVASNSKARSLLNKLAAASSKGEDIQKSSLVHTEQKQAIIPLDRLQWKRFMFAFTVPNLCFIVAGSLPTVFAFVCLILACVALFQTTISAAKSHKRDLATTGWYIGGFLTGCTILIWKMFPVVVNSPFRQGLMILWAIFCILMLCCYFRVLLGNPGILPSRRDHREEMYEMAKAGKLPDRAHYSWDVMVKKSNRSKYCTTTHVMIARFDHYCVWLGNSVGAGNHVYFVGFCLMQFCAQICVFIFVYFFYSQALSTYTKPLGGLCDIFDFFLGKQYSLVTFFLIGYNFMAFFFVIGVLLTQLLYIGRALTSNEVWFPNKYDYLIAVGNTTISMYDAGFLNNWKDFFKGRTHENEFSAPPKNPVVHRKEAIARKRLNSQMQQQCCKHAKGGHHHTPVVSSTFVDLTGANADRVDLPGVVDGGSIAGTALDVSRHTSSSSSSSSSSSAGGVGDDEAAPLLASPQLPQVSEKVLPQDVSKEQWAAISKQAFAQFSAKQGLPQETPKAEMQERFMQQMMQFHAMTPEQQQEVIDSQREYTSPFANTLRFIGMDIP